MGVLDQSVFLFIGYWVTSIGEWFYHQYGMHASDPNMIPTKAAQEICKRHIIHHMLTKFDMSLMSEKNDLKYDQYKIDKKVSKYEGIFFLWPATIVTYIFFAPGFLIINYVLKYLLSSIMIYNISWINALFCGTIYCVYLNAMWNYIHPELHFVKQLKLSEGIDFIPRWKWINDTGFYQFLWQNHVLHHLCKGINAGNYNVTYPGADWLFGTYRADCKGYKVDSATKQIIKLA